MRAIEIYQEHQQEDLRVSIPSANATAFQKAFSEKRNKNLVTKDRYLPVHADPTWIKFLKLLRRK